jgi:SPP1 family predicted phage head-tail adaptor
MIEVGKLRHRVRFDRLTSDLDSNGDPVQNQETGALSRSWVPVATVWAWIRPISAREFRASASEQNELACDIVTRYNSLISDAANLRAVHVVDGVDGRVFDIAGPQPDVDSLQEYFTFPARAGVSDGE